MDLVGTLATDSGMHAVWDRAHFPGVHDYETWALELCEEVDLERHIVEGHVVPINIGSDGVFAIAVRADQRQRPVLGAEEQRRSLVCSEPYRFRCVGHVDVSGIEYVSSDPAIPMTASASLPAGDYEAVVHLLDWDDLPVRTESNPDFIVTMGPATPGSSFRTSAATFSNK